MTAPTCERDGTRSSERWRHWPRATQLALCLTILGALLGSAFLPRALTAVSAASTKSTASTASDASPGVMSDSVTKAMQAFLPLQLPVEGIAEKDLVDSFDDRRGGGGYAHEAIDILAPRGTAVVAVDSGPVVKLFLSKPGGLTVYQFDPSRSLAYYYAHLDRYAEGLTEGKILQRGDPIGYVGSSGNANPEAPHLHFAVFELGPEQQWWKGRAINPLPLFLSHEEDAPSSSARLHY